jgi:hypothetical protein
VLIENYTSLLSFGEFEKDRKTIDAVIRNFEIIGEASSKLPKEFREKYPEVPYPRVSVSWCLRVYHPIAVSPLMVQKRGRLKDLIS